MSTDTERHESAPFTVAIFAPTADVLAMYARRLPLDAVPAGTTCWAVFLGVARAVDCTLVALPASVGGGGTVGEPGLGLPGGRFDPHLALVELRGAVDGAGIVCAAQRLATRRAVAGLADEVLPLDASVPRLWAALESARTAAILARAATALGSAPHFRLAARLAARLALTGSPPLTSVAALCAAARLHRHTLWRQWRSAVGAPTPRVEDLIAWVLMLRATMLRARGVTWDRAAESLGVHRHTLARSAERLAGCSLDEIGEDMTLHAQAVLRRKFTDKLLRPLALD